MELKHLIVSVVFIFLCCGHGQKSENAAPIKSTSPSEKDGCKMGFCELFGKACKNGGSCVPVPKSNGCSSDCVCVEGFSGHNCEIATESAKQRVQKYHPTPKKEKVQRKSILMQLFRALRFTGTSNGDRIEQKKFSNNLNEHSSTSVLDKSKSEPANVVTTTTEKPKINKIENNLGNEELKHKATNTADQSKLDPKKVTTTVSVKDQTTVKTEKTTTLTTTETTTTTTTEKIKTTIAVKRKKPHRTGMKGLGSPTVTGDTMIDLGVTSSTNGELKKSTTTKEISIDEVHSNKSVDNQNVIKDTEKTADGPITSSETSTEIKQKPTISRILNNNLKTSTSSQIKTESLTDKSTLISNYVTSTAESVGIPKLTSPLPSDTTLTTTTADTVTLSSPNTVGDTQLDQDEHTTESKLHNVEIIPKIENKEKYLSGDKYDPNAKSDIFSDAHRVSVSFENSAKSIDGSSHTTRALPMDTSTSATISTTTVQQQSKHNTSTSSNAVVKSYSITSGKFQKSDETAVDRKSNKKIVNYKQSSIKGNPTPLSDQTQSTVGMPDTMTGEVPTSTQQSPTHNTVVSGTSLIGDIKQQTGTKTLPKINEYSTGNDASNGNTKHESEKTGEKSNIAESQNGKSTTKSDEDKATVTFDTTTIQLSQKEQTVPQNANKDDNSKARDLFDSLAKEFSNSVSSAISYSSTTKVPDVPVVTAINEKNINIKNDIGRQSVSGQIQDLKSTGLNGKALQLTANSVNDKYDKTMADQISEKSERITSDEQNTLQHTNIELPSTTVLPPSNLGDQNMYKPEDHLAEVVTVSGKENIPSTTVSSPTNSVVTHSTLSQEGNINKKMAKEKGSQYMSSSPSDVSSTPKPKPISQDGINDPVLIDKISPVKLGKTGTDTKITIVNENTITNEMLVTESMPSRGDFLNEIVGGSNNINSNTLESEKAQNERINMQDILIVTTTPKAGVNALSTTIDNVDVIKTTGVADPISTVAPVGNKDQLLLPNAEG